MKLVVTEAGIEQIPLTPEERAVRDAEEAAWEQESNRLQILAQIAALEAQQTPRRMREAVLGTDGGWLETVAAQIQILRGQL